MARTNRVTDSWSQISRSKVIFVSFATLRRPKDVDVFVKAAGRDLKTVRAELVGQYPLYDAATAKGKPSQSESVIVGRVSRTLMDV